MLNKNNKPEYYDKKITKPKSENLLTIYRKDIDLIDKNLIRYLKKITIWKEIMWENKIDKIVEENVREEEKSEYIKFFSEIARILKIEIKNDIKNDTKYLKIFLKLLIKRFEIVQKIWEYKKENNLKILDSNRWEEVLNSKIKIWKENWIDEKLIKEIWKKIHEFAIKLESKKF